MTSRVWKLTDQDLRTYQGHQWRIGESFETNGSGELCGSGFIHAYTHPALSVLLNPIHANFHPATMRLWPAQGVIAKTDHGLKVGCTRLVLLPDEVNPIPVVTTEQRVTFAIFSALRVCAQAPFVVWAERWLSGADRSSRAAEAAGAAAWVAAVAEAAARAAAKVAEAAEAAAWAAEAAREAAWAAAWPAATPLNLIKIAEQATQSTVWPR